MTDKKRYAATEFHSSKVPLISIYEYLSRIRDYSTDEAIITSLIYLDRLNKKSDSLVLNSLTVHRLLLTSNLLALKVNEDKFFSNNFFAKVGGVSTREMNTLEISFLELIG